MSYEKFDIALLGGGAAVAQVNHWVAEAVKDALDPNKDREKVRIVTMKIKIACDAAGEKAGIQYEVVPKFPPDCAGQDMIAIQRGTGTAFINTDSQPELPFDSETGEVRTINKKEGSR